MTEPQKASSACDLDDTVGDEQKPDVADLTSTTASVNRQVKEEDVQDASISGPRGATAFDLQYCSAHGCFHSHTIFGSS